MRDVKRHSAVLLPDAPDEEVLVFEDGGVDLAIGVALADGEVSGLLGQGCLLGVGRKDSAEGGGGQMGR